jgi:hypothetical protein
MQLIGGLVLDGSAGAKLEVHGVKRDPPFQLPTSSPAFERPFTLRITISRGARITAETEACRGK